MSPADNTVVYAGDTAVYADEIVSTLTLTKFGMSNLYETVIHVALLANEIIEMNGDEKKALVLRVVYFIIEKDDGPLDRFDDIIQPLVSSIIDEYLVVNTEDDLIRKPCGWFWVCDI